MTRAETVTKIRKLLDSKLDSPIFGIGRSDLESLLAEIKHQIRQLENGREVWRLRSEFLEKERGASKAEIECLKKELFDVSDLSVQKSGHIEQLKVYRGLASSLNAKLEKLEAVRVAADFYIKIDGSKDANKVWAARCGLRDKLDAAKEGL